LNPFGANSESSYCAPFAREPVHAVPESVVAIQFFRIRWGCEDEVLKNVDGSAMEHAQLEKINFPKQIDKLVKETNLVAGSAVAFVDAIGLRSGVVGTNGRRKSESHLVFDVAAMARAMIDLSRRHIPIIRNGVSVGLLAFSKSYQAGALYKILQLWLVPCITLAGDSAVEDSVISSQVEVHASGDADYWAQHATCVEDQAPKFG
jgi:hypothetical protein